jgi:GNAT superfamily N-acetyltransferase
MPATPEHEIRVFGNGEALPAEAEALLAEELAYSRRPLPDNRPDRDEWRFVTVCAVAAGGHVLGAAHFDVGPANFGPLGRERMAFLEQVLVRPEYRRRGVGARILSAGLGALKRLGCVHVQHSVAWSNPAAIALYRKCGFALVDVSDDEDASRTDGEYFVVKPLRQ